MATYHVIYGVKIQMHFRINKSFLMKLHFYVVKYILLFATNYAFLISLIIPSGRMMMNISKFKFERMSEKVSSLSVWNNPATKYLYGIHPNTGEHITIIREM